MAALVGRVTLAEWAQVASAQTGLLAIGNGEAWVAGLGWGSCAQGPWRIVFEVHLIGQVLSASPDRCWAPWFGACERWWGPKSLRVCPWVAALLKMGFSLVLDQQDKEV